ncbi:MAG: hypothetical protein JRG82_08290 [Deltaproteobacteria bacterium]|nr:hypothetical protein [Deltaproteobacteria bacterium]
MLIGALVFFALIAGTIEGSWRRLGYVPSILDGVDRWSAERDRAGPGTIALVGSSRVLFNVSIPTLRRRYPEHPVAQLGIGGTLAGAVLRDLAEDPAFDGAVIASMRASAFEPANLDSQQPWVDYYHEEWNVERRISRRLETELASRLAIMNPTLSIRRLGVERVEKGRWLPDRWLVFNRDRSVSADFRLHRVSKSALRMLAKARYDKMQRSDPGAWLGATDRIEGWIERIQARGGRVAIVRFPTSGAHWEFDEKAYPREHYWDRFAARTSAVTLHFRDSAALSSFRLPDGSHVDFRRAPAFTRALIDALESRGFAPPSPRPRRVP